MSLALASTALYCFYNGHPPRYDGDVYTTRHCVNMNCIKTRFNGIGEYGLHSLVLYRTASMNPVPLCAACICVH